MRPSRRPLVIGLLVVVAIGAGVAFALRPTPTVEPKVAVPEPVAAPPIEPKVVAPPPPPPPAAVIPPPPPEELPGFKPAPPPVAATSPKHEREVSTSHRRASTSRKKDTAPAPSSPAHGKSGNANGAPIID